MTAPAPLDAAIEQISDAVAVSRTAINKWIVDDRRVPKADLVGYLVLLADLVDPLLAALSADKRLERAEAALREIADNRCDCESTTDGHLNGCPRRASVKTRIAKGYLAAFDRAAGEGETNG